MIYSSIADDCKEHSQDLFISHGQPEYALSFDSLMQVSLQSSALQGIKVLFEDIIKVDPLVAK